MRSLQSMQRSGGTVGPTFAPLGAQENVVPVGFDRHHQVFIKPSLSPVIKEGPLCRMNFPIVVTDPNINAYLREIKFYIVGPTEHLPFVEVVKFVDFI